MPAPRLLDKKIVNAQFATERKQNIDEGLRLSKAIEALRETKVKEEQALEDFREHTMKVVNAEVEQKKQKAYVTLRELQREEEASKVRIEGLRLIESQLKEEISKKL